MSDHGPRYGKALMERIAPDGVWTRRSLVKAAPLVLFVVLLLWVLFGALESGNAKAIAATFALLSLFFVVVAIMMNNRASNLFGRFLMPQGNASPYQRDFSFEKSLVMQGRIVEALAAYEEQIRARPTEPDAFIQGAELNFSAGNMARGIEIFRRVRLIDTVPDSTRIYATNRLIDAYLGKGPCQDASKARSELRYLIVHFPGTQAAEKAHAVLAKM